MQEFKLDDWTIDPEGGTFSKGDHSVHVEPKVMDVLLCLAKAGGQVVSRDALLQDVWGDVIVGEEALTRCISELRTLLGDTERRRHYIRTVPKRGYALLINPQFNEGAQLFGLIEAADSVDPSIDMNERRIEEHNGNQTGKRHIWLFGSTVAAAIAAVFLYLSFQANTQTSSTNSTESNIKETVSVTEVVDSDRLNQIVAGNGLPSLAVLPFRNLSVSEQDRFVAEALAEDLRSDLTRTQLLRVAARTSSRAFRDEVQDIRKIGSILSVNHLVEGSVRVDNGELRANIQLTDAKSGYQIWADVFTRPRSEVLALGRDITEALLNQVIPDKALTIQNVPYQGDPGAYSLYLLGRHNAYQNTAESRPKAIDYFNQAIKIDDEFSRAYAELAQVHMEVGRHYKFVIMDPMKIGAAWQNAMDTAKPLIQKARSIDPNSAEVLVAQARHMSLGGESEGAIAVYYKALEINPAMPMARLALGRLLGKKDEVELAFLQYSTALQTDPLHPLIQQAFLSGLMKKGDYSEVSRYAEHFFQQSGEESLLQLSLKSYLLTGQYDKALSFSQGYNFSSEYENHVTYAVAESLYYLQRIEEADQLRQQNIKLFSPYQYVVLGTHRGISLRDAEIVYRAADELESIDAGAMGKPEVCVKPFADYWRAYGAYIEKDFSLAEKYFISSKEGGFLDCMTHPDMQVSFYLYYSHTLQNLEDVSSASAMLQQSSDKLKYYVDRGWGGARLSLYNIALRLLQGNFGQANDELESLRKTEIEPFGMISAEPIFDDFYANPKIKNTLSLAKHDFEKMQENCADQQLVKFGI